MLVDQPRFRKRLKKLRAHHDASSALARLGSAIDASKDRRRTRANGLPEPRFPDDLPVSRRRAEIAELIEQNQVCIVCGDTGSGKTTQIPKICMSLGRGVAGFIGHTQPRRIAARAVAARIAQELDCGSGTLVGYKIRFQDNVRSGTYLKLMTDGILLAELHDDRLLRQYDTLIIDEAHERSLNIDFLLGYAKRILPKRPELKLIITSATINPQRFSAHFGDAPVLELEGRQHPIAVQYRALAPEAEAEMDLQSSVLEAVQALVGEGDGDVLVFLSGEREIRDCEKAISRLHLPRVEVVPLYGRLSSRDQDRVFARSERQKIVLSTNVAETSLTLPNIGYVVDTGRARISRYSYRSKIQRLPIEKISRASAEQRKGRCGRTGPGTCVRLYSEDALASWPEYTEPEIKRTNLAAVILRMKSLGLGDIEDFPFLDPPDRRYVNDGLRLLRELAAVDPQGGLTSIGTQLARFPVDPRVGRMILAAHEERSLREILVIASVLSSQDPFERPLELQQAAAEAQAPFRDKRSDFLAYLNLWRDFHRQGRHSSKVKLRRWCRDHFVSWLRMREWQEVHQQLAELARELQLEVNEEAAGYMQIHRAILSGSLGLIGCWSESSVYAGARGSSFALSPASSLYKKNAKWLMAAELIETQRVYAHRAASIRPEWIERCAPEHLLSRRYFEPYFDVRRGRTYAHQAVTLYGLTVTADRPCPYDAIDPQEARRIFIASGLVEGRFRTNAKFLAHNQALAAELRSAEHKSRRTDIVLGDAGIADFYAERIPARICRGSSFEGWRREAEAEHPELLYLKLDQLRRADAPSVAADDFPDYLRVRGHRFPLRYRFAPGDDDDGVTVTLPAPFLNQLPGQPFEWLVPGMLRDKLLALLRSLPKALRKNFVPAPEFADACLAALEPGAGSVTDGLSKHLFRMTGVEVPPGAWQVEKLSPHLLMNFELVGAMLEPIGCGRDFYTLRTRYARLGERGFEALRASELDRDGLTDWSFDELPAEVELQRGSMRLKGYPALIDEGSTVALRLLDTPEKAAHETRKGLKRLLEFRLARDLKRIMRGLPDIDRLCLLYSSVKPLTDNGSDGLKQDIVDAALGYCFLEHSARIRSRAAFEAWVNEGLASLGVTVNRICDLLGEVLENYHRVRAGRRDLPMKGIKENLIDIDSQMKRLVYRGFVSRVPLTNLEHYPRYLKGLEERMRKLKASPLKDSRRMRELRPAWERYLAVAAKHNGESDSAALDRIRWMIEELRIATFAQTLGTPTPISAKRIEAAWNASDSDRSVK